MAGSVGFLSMEVKLDLDNAEKGLRDLAKTAKAELGKPIKIDDASFRGLASTLAALEGTYADTLAIVTRMNASTANLARSTQAVAAAARYANDEAARSVRLEVEREKTARENVRLAQEQAKAQGAVAAAQAKAQGLSDYGAQQQEMIAAKQQAVQQERIHKSVLDEVAAEQKSVNDAVKEHAKLINEVNKLIDETDKAITDEQERALSIYEAQTAEIKKQSALRAGFRTATAGIDWGVTAVGAAQARNYGYAVGALIQMGKSMVASLKAVPPAAIAATAGVAAIIAAAAAATASIAKLTWQVAKLGATGGVELEQMVVQMNALLPTADMARQEIAGLFELGTRTIAPTTSLIELDRRLLLAGGSAAQMRQQIVEGYAAFTTAVGASTEQMNALNYLIGEVTLKGRLMRTEMSQQFATSGIGQAEFLQATAEATGKSVSELNTALEEGTFNADMFLQGLTAYFAKFSAGAEGALATVKALNQNIREQIGAALSKAFYEAGVTSGLSKILLSVQSVVQRITPYFDLIGQKVALFVATVARGFRQIAKGGGGDAIAFLFGSLIPTVIELATKAVQVGLAYIRVAIQAFGLIVKSLIAPMRTFYSTIKGVGSGFKVLAAAAVTVLAPIATVAATVRILVGAGYAAAYAVLAVARALRGDFSGAAAAAYSAVGSLALGFKDAWAMAKGFSAAVKSAAAGSAKIKTPDLSNSGRNPAAVQSASPTKDSAGKGGDAAKKAAQDIASALAELYDATRRWLGQRSELEQSLLGGLRGFTATADQIVEQGIRIVKTLRKAGYSAKSGLVTAVKGDIEALSRLADRRDALTKRLEAQQSKLEDLLGERSQMVANVRQGITSFVAALAVEQETVTDYMRLDAVGSFIITEKKKSKSWVGAMKERLAAAKEFVANIRKLKSKGLNPETIRQLVEAGPEAAAAAVSELTAGGQDTIDEVNAIQSELSGLAGEFADEQAGDYYDAGIATTEALIAGTKAKIAQVEKAADEIGKALNRRLAKIARPAAEAGEAAGEAVGGGIGEGLAAGLPDVGGTLKGWGLPEGIEGLTGDVTESAEELGRNLVGSLMGSIKEKLTGWGEKIKGWFSSQWEATKTWFTETLPAWFGQKASGVWTSIQTGFFNVREWFAGRFSAMKTWFTESLPTWFRNNTEDVWAKIKTGFFNVREWFAGRFDAMKTWLKESLPAWFRNNMGAVWANVKSGFPGMLTWVKSKFSAAIDWLGGKGAYSGGGLPGAIRSALNSVIRVWNNLSFTFPKFTGDWNGPLPGGAFTVGGWTMNTPNVPYLASGGYVSAPTLAVVGERGDEAVLPLSSDQAMGRIADAIVSAMDSRGGAVAPEVRVYIGDREISDIVRVEVTEQNRQRGMRVYAGRGS